MHLQPAESNGPQPSHELSSTPPKHTSSALPFGHHVPLSAISPATYLTGQTLIQQTAYLLSDKIFTYSPETFDLDLALQQWQQQAERNVHNFTPGVQQLQTRTGAGTIALGYMFSPDFDIAKRDIPQSIVATSGTLLHLRSSLDQVALLYSVASPVALQIAAVDYTVQGHPSLVVDYVTPQTVAEDLGLHLISSCSIFESQHMALLSLLMAKEAPTMHVYDGVHVGRETTRVVDVLGKDGLGKAFKNVSKDVAGFKSERLDPAGKMLKLLEAFNDELGTDYKPFEYYGHAEAETVLVVFGSVEGALVAQVATVLAQEGKKVGAINVRVYRPFVEKEFVEALPSSVRNIKVLGQVHNAASVADAGEQSHLYTDVLAAVAFSSKFNQSPSIEDLKYARNETWTPAKIASAIGESREADILGPTVKQYSFWDLDGSPSAKAVTPLAEVLANSIPDNVSVRSSHNNLVRGGTVRSDLRTSSKSIEAPYAVGASSFTFVGDQDVWKDFNVLRNVQQGSIVLARLPGSKDQEEEKLSKRFPEPVRADFLKKDLQLYLIDPEVAPTALESPGYEALLVQLAFLRLTESRVSPEKFESYFSKDTIAALSSELDDALVPFPLPEVWKECIESSHPKALPVDVRNDSFVPYPADSPEPKPAMSSTTTLAQALAFREACNTEVSLRPDSNATTKTIYVKEHRRLTPKTYDRNIFHIEFDLADSGLKYNLGEALGIHAENNVIEVTNFITNYGLDPDAIVSVPARIDPDNLTENRTIYQALVQNIDIFGQPPKRFYAELAEFATNTAEKAELAALGGPEGAVEFKRRAEVDTITYADILVEFPSAHPPFPDVVRLVSPLKRREYSIASSQHAQPDTVSLLIVTVGWVDPRGRDRFGLATRYLDNLQVGDPLTVSVKPSVMKLPASTTAPILMAGLGTGLAPFRAFVQERAYQRDVLGKPIGSVMLFLGSRHQREEYLYGEEWEAYLDAGVLTHVGCAFSRDQPQKIYIQGRMREAMSEIRKAVWREGGSFYLCGPTWPVPDVTEVLEESVEQERKEEGVKKVNRRREIEELKDEGRYVLEVY